ncbi:mas-related G-protein coupled receptor member X2-like [Rhinolophus ferrumequinum]|uniref:G-protein coupled receptors family 1 profile domain-containing protein n=1 Tax=Rhinolophus ferrumequinum TaxID=59479 RepID=A0A671G1E3_RHIFE|nr:mas-related G-protein coupled receptor member X2-like [Rhinolophus ferrumequinum]
MNATVTASAISLTTINGSDQATPRKETMRALISFFLVTIIPLVGLAGNAVVLWLLGFRMRRNTISIYILNLAGADFLFLCCQIMYSLETLTDYFHSVPISNPSFFMTVFAFAYVAGLSFLSTISTERCLSVLWPIWYRCHRPRHTSAVMCALLWALCLLLSILNGIYCGLLVADFSQVWCPVFNFITAGWLIFLCVLLSGSSLALVTRLLCGSQRVQPTRLYVTVLLTVLVFLLCGLPWGICLFLMFWITRHSDEFSHLVNIVAFVLTCVNSCANPIIYFFVGSFRQRWRKGRQTLKLVLQRALQDTPEGDEHGGRPPQETLEMSGSTLVS